MGAILTEGLQYWFLIEVHLEVSDQVCLSLS